VASGNAVTRAHRPVPGGLDGRTQDLVVPAQRRRDLLGLGFP
jgi:hypothetical protein